MNPPHRLRPSLPILLAAGFFLSPASYAGFGSKPAATRELLPPYLVFLLPAPETAELVEKGAWRISVETSLSSSFAGNSAFRSMSSPVPGERLEVNQALVDSFLAANPGTDLFFVDGEVLRSALRASWGVHDRVEVGLEVPLIRFSGGIMDGAIENFHDAFGFPNDGRANFQRKAFNVVLYLGNSDFLLTEPPTDFGVGDLTLSAKTLLYRNPRSGATVSGSVYLKLPTGAEEDLLGSGSADYGAQILFSREWNRQACHFSFGAAYLGDWDLIPEIDPENIYFGSGTYELLMTEIWSLVGQLGITASPFRDATTEDLADPSIRINAGFRWRLSSGLSMEGLIEENFNRTNASADFGLHFGLSIEF